MNDRIQLRFDGMVASMAAIGLPAFQFTEHNPDYASYGATFYCDSNNNATVSRRREEIRAKFEAARKQS